MTVSEDNGGIHKTCRNPSQASYTVGERNDFAYHRDKISNFDDLRINLAYKL